MKKIKVTLGCTARDTVSGWEGIVTAEYRYMNGCIRYELSGRDKDGKPTGFVFDQQQVEAVVPDAHPVTPTTARRTGGSQSSKPVDR